MTHITKSNPRIRRLLKRGARRDMVIITRYFNMNPIIEKHKEYAQLILVTKGAS